jgi:DNA-binding CsgD family transcriptional regulator
MLVPHSFGTNLQHPGGYMKESFIDFEAQLDAIFKHKAPSSNIAFNFWGNMNDGNHIIFSKYGTGKTSGVEGALFCRESDLIVKHFRKMVSTITADTISNAYVCWTATFAERPTDFFKDEKTGRRKPTRIIPCNKTNECATSYVAIAVDLDYQLATVPVRDADDMFSRLMDNYVFPGIIPNPTIVNCSGHGLHVIWALPRKICIPTKSKISKANYKYYLATLKVLQHLLAPLGADSNVGPTHWLRIPGTINAKPSKDKIYCRQFLFNPKNIIDLKTFLEKHSSLVEISYDKNDMPQITFHFDSPVNAPQGEIRYNHLHQDTLCHHTYVSFTYDQFDPSANTNSHKLHHGNLALDLAELLVNFRDSPGDGRETLLFYVALHLRWFYADTPNAVVKTSIAIYKINTALNHPLSGKEIDAHVLRSAYKYYNSGSVYNQFLWKNERYISAFGISDEECRCFRYLLTERERNQRRARRNARKKQKQKEKYWEKKAAANIPSKKEEIQRRQEYLAEIIQSGQPYTLKELADLFCVSVKTIRNDIKKIQSH